MTCSHCCDSNKFFDLKSAEKELKQYKKKGAQGTTKKLIEAVSKIDKSNKSLLDIGGGIGAIQWDFLQNGARSTTDIDASSGYLRVAETFAKEKNWQDQTEFKLGDFNDLTDSLQPHDCVSLDKVVCCYPDYQLILTNALSKTKTYLIMSFPMSNWGSKVVNLIGKLFFKLKKSEFRTYIHPVKEMETLIIENGFQAVHKNFKFPWLIRVYQRVSE